MSRVFTEIDWNYARTRLPWLCHISSKMMCKVDQPEGVFHTKLYLCLHATLMMSHALSCCNLFVFFTAAFTHAVVWSTIPMAAWFILTQLPRRSCGLWGSFWPYKDPRSLAGFPVGGFWFLSLHIWFTPSLFLSPSLWVFFFCLLDLLLSAHCCCKMKSNSFIATTHTTHTLRVNICDRAHSYDNNVYS